MRHSITRPSTIFLLHIVACIVLMFLPFDTAIAGFDEGRAAYGRGDYATAFREYKAAADRGNARAQGWLGHMYQEGYGVPKDYRQAEYWYRTAADQGDASGQFGLGMMYFLGTGVQTDKQQAYFWWILASTRGGHEWVAFHRDNVEYDLTPAQRATVQAAARNWVPVVAGSNDSTTAPNPFAQRVATTTPTAPDTTGSGFAVAGNRLVTNAHVIEGCARVSLAGGRSAKVYAVDRRNDLALLEVNGLNTSATLRAGRLRQGDAVSVVGFPLAGVLASGAQVTSGNVSALAGMQNDSRFIQISAPVQPGNSGGPLVDASGNVVGVVVSKLNASKMAEITGDIPQNVNFAVSPLVLQGFLEANNVNYQSAPSTRNLSTADVTDIAKRYTFLVQCWK